MADPLSITASAIAVAGVALTLYKDLKSFLQGCQEVDQNIHDLQSGVKQVQDVCLLIEKHVKLLPQSEPENTDNEDLLIGIDTQLAGCAAVVQKVRSKIEKVRGSRSDVVSRTYRAVRLNMNKEDIGECKTQIQAGISNLQLSLQLVNLQATYIAPQIANRTLLEKLEEIQKLLTVQSIDQRLQECADTYLTKGATLYEKSVASSIGGAQSQSRPKAIAEWLEQLDALKLDGSVSPSLPPDDDLYSSPSQSLHSPETSTTLRNDTRMSISLVAGFDDDDEAEFAMEMVQAALESGRASYKDMNYQEAETRLGECLALLRKLPENRRRGYNIEEIHLLLALCAFQLHDPTTAEAALVSALDCNTGMSTHTELHYEAASALAIVYIRLDKYEPARFTCENVYKGRRKLLGKDHDLCFESLELLAYIHELQELPARADTFRSMIPKDKQQALHKRHSQSSQIQSPPAYNQDDPDVDEGWTILNDLMVWCLAISSASKMVAYGVTGRSELRPAIEMRYLDSCRTIRTMPVSEGGPAKLLEFDNVGARLFSAHGGVYSSQRYSLSIRVWDVTNGDCLRQFNVGGLQDNMLVSGLSYNPVDDGILFSYNYIADASIKSRMMGKLMPGFTVLNSTSGRILRRGSVEDCHIGNFSQDFQMVSLCTKKNTKVYETKSYTKVLKVHKTTGATLLMSDGSLFRLQTNGTVIKNDDVWLNLNPPPEAKFEKAKSGHVGLSKSGKVVIVFVLETAPGQESMVITVPEIDYWRTVQASDDDNGDILSYKLSEDSAYLAYVRRHQKTRRIRVVSLRKALQMETQDPSIKDSNS